MSEQVQIFTLKQVVSSIRKTIEERYNREYWVKAEMHKLGQTKAGHCYPELVQKEDGKIVAEMRGTIWKHNYDRINKRFIEVVKEPLKEDTTLLLKVKVNFHEIYGISLQISDIDPNYTLGELHRERAETLKRLQAENLLNANQKIPFPLLPKRVAIISAESSKGLSDFMKVIDQNEWNYRFFTMLFPATLQGGRAEHTIIEQLEKILRVQDHFDIVVIVRGGGGEVGMSCYNNYNLCKAIASFPMPILTGIGHSTNLTVAEMVSFRNAITPTELGDFLIQAFHNFSVPLKESIKTIKLFSEKKLREEKYHLSTTTSKYSSEVAKLLENERFGLSRIGDLLNSTTKRSFQLHQDRLSQYRRRSVNGGKIYLQDEFNQIENLSLKLPQSIKNNTQAFHSKLEQLELRVRLLDPINILNRGYSISTLNGLTISEQNPAKKGDKIKTKTSTFSIDSTVNSINKNE